MESKTTSIVEKGKEMRRIMLGTVVTYYITVVDERQDVRLEVEDQERSQKKPGKTPEEVHTSRKMETPCITITNIMDHPTSQKTPSFVRSGTPLPDQQSNCIFDH